MVDTSSGSLYTRRGAIVQGDGQTMTALFDMGTGGNPTIKACSSTHGVDPGGNDCEINGLWMSTPFESNVCIDDNGADINKIENNWFMYRKNKNPFHKEKRTDGHMLGLMGMVSPS